MQRRQILKLVLPLALLSASAAGVVLGRKLMLKTDCTTPGPAALLAHLKPFSDAELGKAAAAVPDAASLQRLGRLCEQDFDQHYRQLVQLDFAEGRRQQVDGWILSQTEALTHRLVSQPALLSGVLPAGD
jgi:hypothetical protein